MILLQRIEILLVCISIFAAGCSTPTKCRSFFSYESRTLDVRAISKRVGHDSSQIKKLDVGRITIKKEAVAVSERLKELDMLQVYLCSQVQSIKDFRLKDSLRKEIAATTLEMLMIAQQTNDSLFFKKISQLEIKIEQAKNEIDAQGMLITTMSINLKVEASTNWGEENPYIQLMSPINDFKTIILIDTTGKNAEISFYLNEYYYKRKDSITYVYSSKQSLKDGSGLLGKSVSEIQKFNILWFMVPFLSETLKIDKVDILNVELEIFVNGKSHNLIRLPTNPNVKTFTDNFHTWFEQYIVLKSD